MSRRVQRPAQLRSPHAQRRESPALPSAQRDSSTVTQPQPCPVCAVPQPGAPPVCPGHPHSPPHPGAPRAGEGGLHGQGDGQEPAMLCTKEGSSRVREGGWLEGAGGPDSQGAGIPPTTTTAMGLGVAGGHRHADSSRAKSPPSGKSPAGVRAARQHRGHCEPGCSTLLAGCCQPWGVPAHTGPPNLASSPTPAGGHATRRDAARESGFPRDGPGLGWPCPGRARMRGL